MTDVVVDTYKNSKCTLEDLVQIHLGALFPANRFSKFYLTLRMKYVSKMDDSIIVVAYSEKGHLLGLVYGGPEGYKKEMNRELLPVVVKNIFIKPYLLFNRQVLLVIKNKFINNKKSSMSHGYEKIRELPCPLLRLTGIVTNEQSRGRGIGEQLLNKFELEAAKKEFKSIILNTPLHNKKGINFYKKYGWKDLGELEENKYYFSQIIQ